MEGRDGRAPRIEAHEPANLPYTVAGKETLSPTPRKARTDA